MGGRCEDELLAFRRDLSSSQLQQLGFLGWLSRPELLVGVNSIICLFIFSKVNVTRCRN